MSAEILLTVAQFYEKITYVDDFEGHSGSSEIALFHRP